MAVADEIFLNDHKRFYATKSGDPVFHRTGDAPDPLSRYSEEQTSQWRTFQKNFVAGVHDGTEKALLRTAVQDRWDVCERYFTRRGPLAGNVLDIGGGWGLYREWWTARPGESFVVHDPGLDRFEHGTNAAHQEIFSKALSRPLVFVEGYGESLPYKDGLFDTAMISSCLDHCIEPDEVLRQAYRCLKPGGTFLALEHIEDMPSLVPQQYSIRARVARVARDPRRVMGFVRTKLAHDPHIHHFTKASLEKALRGAGFMRVSVDVLDVATRFVAVEGMRPWA